ncbi:hypothetical protein [Deinococcus sp. YIM 77859]|uniref:hypothetical protein n=1 Tax=Deinococcus sp. YIM 77859 TaxID=1540221 RepID=UPI0009DF370F|nr:hypothetical protein [Deinococcus sp. YIM 77859]
MTAWPTQAAAPTPAPSWSAAVLARATYVILPPRIEGNVNLVTGEQRTAILEAMRRDSARAIKRRYPQATIATDPQTPDAVKVTPVLTAPQALVPWAKLTAHLYFDLGDGQRVAVNDQFGLLTLWQQQADAANYVYDRLAQKLP